MPKGPILNDISRSFTTRDSLGIEGVATTIQASICPVIRNGVYPNGRFASAKIANNLPVIV